MHFVWNRKQNETKLLLLVSKRERVQVKLEIRGGEEEENHQKNLLDQLRLLESIRS